MEVNRRQTNYYDHHNLRGCSLSNHHHYHPHYHHQQQRPNPSLSPDRYPANRCARCAGPQHRDLGGRLLRCGRRATFVGLDQTIHIRLPGGHLILEILYTHKYTHAHDNPSPVLSKNMKMYTVSTTLGLLSTHFSFLWLCSQELLLRSELLVDKLKNHLTPKMENW